MRNCIITACIWARILLLIVVLVIIVILILIVIVIIVIANIYIKQTKLKDTTRNCNKQTNYN